MYPQQGNIVENAGVERMTYASWSRTNPEQDGDDARDDDIMRSSVPIQLFSHVEVTSNSESTSTDLACV